MNNTRNILLVTIFAATVVLGTSVIPMQSYADRGDSDDRKKDNNYKSKTSAIYESGKKSSSQHQDQDNLCYRGNETCTQANEGQQLVGKDNDAKGFNDQSENLALSTLGAGTGNATGNGNGGIPVPKTCEECFTFILTAAQIAAINAAAQSDQIAITCNLPTGTVLVESLFITFLTQAGTGIDLSTANALVTCLKAHGVVFIP
jgi:hypothetical protein